MAARLPAAMPCAIGPTTLAAVTVPSTLPDAAAGHAGGGQPACPAAASGRVEGTVTAANVVGPIAQGIAAGNLAAILEMIRAGFGYANMHTARFPSGEIRGQIKVTGGED